MTWQTETSPTTQTLNGVTAIDTTHAWAVSATGQILYRDGTSWSVHSTPTTSALYWVYAQDASDAWAVGATGYILFADPPYIKSVSPDHGDPGDTIDVEVVGGYTHFQDATPTLDFGAGVSMVPGSLNVVDNTTLFARVQVDPGAELGPRDVRVTTGTETPVPLVGGFTVGSDPTITSALPGRKPRGWTGNVEITGSQTGFDDSSHATLGNGVKVNSTDYINSGHVIANVTVSPSAAPGPRDVNVITDAETPTPLVYGFTVATPPAITGISPAAGLPGSVVTITGAGFGDTQYPGGGAPASLASFNGLASGPIAEWSDTRIVCTVPDGATWGPVTVTTPDGTSNANKRFSLNSSTWYLAEGSTAWGFDTDIAVMNPNEEAVTVRPTFMTSGGPVTKPDITLPANSTRLINPGSEYDIHTDFSTKVECLEGKTIALDRTMHWLGQGAAAAEGHASIGVTSPANTWYLAEGSSDWGFECWLLVQNPGANDADCQVTYMLKGGSPVTVTKTVPARSRRSFNMADDIGAADASIEVRSGVPVIAERSMYRDNRREGSNSIGATAPSGDYYLAEGSTAWGFTTYVLVQNPNPSPTDVTITYMTPSGRVNREPFTVPANSRETVRVNDAAPNKDLSTHVHGSQPIIAERAMYWDGGGGEACHDSIGMDAPHRVFYLPGGQTGYGSERWFETWTLVQNPNDVDVQVKVSYLTYGGEHNVTFTRTVSANSRVSLNMADSLKDMTAGVVVECTSQGRKIMCERSTYWGTAPGSRGAGANTIGGFSD